MGAHVLLGSFSNVLFAQYTNVTLFAFEPTHSKSNLYQIGLVTCSSLYDL